MRETRWQPPGREMGAMETTDFEGSAILLPGEPDELDVWAPEEFDHFTDLGLLRSLESDD